MERTELVGTRDLVTCSECGHLHFNTISHRYEPCPIEACPCPHAPRRPTFYRKPQAVLAQQGFVARDRLNLESAARGLGDTPLGAYDDDRDPA